MKNTYFFIMLILLSFLLFSCKQEEESLSKIESLESFGYYVTNCPYDFWKASTTTGPSLYYTFEIKLPDDVKQTFVYSAKVYINDKDLFWTLDMSEFNETNHFLIGKYFWYSDNKCELPIGKFTAKVDLIDGTELTKSIVMGVPGSKSNGTYQYVYNPDDETSAIYPTVSCKSIQRPVITKFEQSISNISVTFKIIGDNINNGYIWYYDDSNNYIGTSQYFRDPITGACCSGLNTGTGFKSGSNDINTLVTSSSDIKKNDKVISDMDFYQITNARIVVFDGLQYETSTTHSNFDYRAISEKSK